MKTNELKAAIAAGVTEFALWPVDIEAEVPWQLKQRNVWGRQICPRGLVRARLVEQKVEWIERTSIGGCGSSQTYDVKHKNGYLVRFTPEDAAPFRKRDQRHATVHRDGSVSLVVSHKVLALPWAEYAPIEERRERERVEEEKLNARVARAHRAILGRNPRSDEHTTAYSRSRRTKDGDADELTYMLEVPLERVEELVERFKLGGTK